MLTTSLVETNHKNLEPNEQTAQNETAGLHNKTKKTLNEILINESCNQ